ncbi:MAG TPA: hypothetical protein VNZ94_00445 [Xanthobacteraceae bacterium]|nr:hypothetical protein [Xanthobacteraceae bacterium]
MSNLPTTNSPLAADLIVADTLSRHHRKIQWAGNSPTIAHAVPAADRNALTGRLTVLRKALMPMNAMSDRQRIGTALMKLLAGYTNTAGITNPKATITAYIAKLDELPAWAIEAAINDIERGRVEGLSPDFPPSAARIFQVAETKLADVVREKGMVEQVLSARVVEQLPLRDPDEVQRIAASMRAMAEEFKAQVAGDKEEADQKQKELSRRTIEANDQRILAEYRMRGLEPAMFNGRPVSLSLARITGAEIYPASQYREAVGQ